MGSQESGDVEHRELNESERANLQNQFDNAREEVNRDDVTYVISKADTTAKRLMDSNQSWLQLLGNQAKLLWELLRDWRNDKYDIPWRVVAAVTAALLYLVNPYDFMPDFIPVMGWVDDAMVLKFAYNLIKTDLRDYAIHRGLNLEDNGL